MKKNDCICGITTSTLLLTGSILIIGDFFSESFLTGSILLGSGILFSITYTCITGLRNAEERDKLLSSTPSYSSNP